MEITFPCSPWHSLEVIGIGPGGPGLVGQLLKITDAQIGLFLVRTPILRKRTQAQD